MSLKSSEVSQILRNGTLGGFQPSLSFGEDAEVTGNALTVASDVDSQKSEEHRTTLWQTFVHMLKGYMGAGCLSLPWALSRLGVFWGILAILSVSFWSSYNCWTIVRLKRYIERQTTPVDDKQSEASSVATSITYPDVGEWAYGGNFQSYVTACVCTQQLAICTVFISFVGENLLAVLELMEVDSFVSTHLGVMTVAMPIILALSLIPNLKLLSPVMTAGTLLLIVSFIAIGVIIQKVWEFRPDELPQLEPAHAPLAICAILYSYEGINLVLPVESAMIEPKGFKTAFVAAMGLVAMILAGFSTICVVTFGNVTSGSVTAFLLEAYKDDTEIIWWLMVANTAVSLSVLLTYPLQLFPAIELLGPSLTKILYFGNYEGPGEVEDDESDLSGFEPLPPLLEHDMMSYDSIPNMEHQYDKSEDDDNDEDVEDGKSQSSVSKSGLSMVSIFPEMTMSGDSPRLRVFLVTMTYVVAVVVPNVQSLISLAGALAGSSSALLIPPLLELAWIKHIETEIEGDDKDTSRFSIFTAEAASFGKWWVSKLKCYFLIALGLVFFFIGTYASLADIVAIYRNG